MRKISKLLCLAVCICMLLAIGLAGCTKTETTQVSTTNTQSSSTPDTAVEATRTEYEPYEIVWYYCGNGTEPDEKLIEEEMGKYLKDKINVTVDINTIPMSEYNDKINTIIKSGETVDLCFTCSWLFPYAKAANEGLFTEITDDMLTKYAPNAKEVLSGPFMDGNKVNNKLYTLSCNKECGAQGGVLLNKALVEKYSFDVSAVKKFEDLYPLLQTIKEKEPGIIPIDLCKGSQIGVLVDCTSDNCGEFSNIKLTQNGTKWTNVFDIPEEVELLKVAKKFVDAGFVSKDAVTITDVMPNMKAGKIFACMQQLKPGKAQEVSANTTPGIEWVQVGLTDNVVRSGDVSGSMMAIPKTCASPERALLFYDYFYHDKDMITLVNYGIENKHYVKVDDKTIDYAPATEGGTKSGWKPPFSVWMVGDQFLNYLLTTENPDKYSELKKFNASCKTFGDSMGFSFDITQCEDLANRYRNANADTYSLMLFGQAGDVDAAMAKQTKIWNDAGMQEMIAEFNKQYQAFLAKK